MSTQVQWKRGTTAQNNTYTGAVGEITVDTSIKQLRLHDGVTPGGTIIGSTAVTVSTATNLAGGTAGQIPYQTAAGATSFFGAGATGTVLVSYGSTGTPTFQNTLTLAGTTAATSTQTGALVVGGGVGIGGNLYVGGDIVANKLVIQFTTVTTTLVQTDDIIQTLNSTQSSSPTTGALQVAGGAGIGLDINVGGSIRVASVITATTFIGNLTGNITGAGTGNLHYQSANNTTSFLSTGTTGQLLVAAGGAPAWTNTSSISVGYAANILGAGTGNILVQIGSNTTNLLSTGTAGQLLMSAGGSPVFTNTASIYVNSSRFSDNLTGGGIGSIPIQSAAGTTAFIPLGTSGFVLTAGTNTATWTAISGLSAGSATTATNLAGGTAGQLPYQTAAGSTSFMGPGSFGQFLMSTGANAPEYQSTLTQANGNIFITSNNRAFSTLTGALQIVNGGIGVGGSIYVGTTATAVALRAGTGATNDTIITGGLISRNGSSISISGGANSSPSIVGGSGLTAGNNGPLDLYGGSGGNINLRTASNHQTVVVSNSATVSTSSGALQIQNGGLGVGGGVFVGGVVTATLFSGSLAGGAGGAIVYQTAANATGFLSTTTTGNFLQSNFNGAPTWTTTASMYVNSAVYAEDLIGGGAGQLPYQSAASATSFISTATTGNFLQANFAGAPTWTTTASMYVGRASFADSSSGSSAQVNTQARSDTGTNFLTFVDSNNASATGELVYTTSSVYVNPSTGLVTGDSFYATNNGNGTNFRVGDDTWIGDINVANTLRITGQQNTGNAYIVFGASDTTALGRAGTGGLTYGGNLIIHAGNTSTAYVGNAVKVETSLQTANASYYPVFVDANNSTAVPESVYTTSTFLINPGTRQVGIGYISTSSALTVNGRIESMTDPAGEGGQLVLRGRTYRWSFDNYFDTFRIIREDDVTEANGTSPFQISSGTTSVLIGYSNAAPTASGEKLGVTGGVFVNGILTATTIYGIFAGTIGGSVTISTATNLANGTAGQLVYQSAPGATSFVSTATTGNFLQANFTSAPTWTTSGTMYVGNAVQAETIKGGGNGSLLYQSAANTTSFLSTGTPGQLLMAAVGAPAFTNTSSIYVNSSRFADELTGAGTGNIVVQVGTNDTQFLSTGTTGQLLVAAGGRPIFTNTSSISVGYAANILGVGTGGILYESANNTTSILSTGTPGQLLMAAVGAPAFTNTSSIYVNSSRFADNLTGGGVGSIPIQSAAGTTAFVPLGTSGFVLTAGATTATWTAVSTLASGTATNIANGLANQLLYQTAPGTTGFISTATTGNFLQATTNGAPSWTGTASMQVGYAANILGAGTGNIHIQSANNTTSLLSTGTTGQLLMSAGGAPVFTNTSSIYVAAATQVNTVLQTTNASYFPTFVDSNNATAGAESFYTTSSFQINPSTGLTSLAGRLAVNNADASTTTNTSNALYVAGGAWINKNLTVSGDTTFQGSVIFQGTNTFVYSSSTVYTDNLISLHAPSGSGPGNHTWTIDDGKDIGFMFHYYKTTDKDAFLGFDNATSYLEWFDNGTESGGVFTGTSFGTFRTGAIKLVGGAVNSGNTSSGDLTVLGGVGIGNNLYVAGNINVAGTINASITGVSTTATNIAGGTAGQLHVQSAPGVTTFAGPGSYGQFLMSTGANAPAYQSTLTQANGNIIVTSNTAVSTTNSGALQVVNGGVGIGGGLVVGNITTITNTTNASSTTTGALQVAGGVGIGGNIYFNGNLFQNGVLFTSGSTSTTSTFTISNTTQSTSTTTGALVVAGGFGLGGNFYSGGTIVNLNGTNATSTTTGALQVINGGAGIGRDLWVGGAIYVAGSRVLPTSIQEFTATGGQTTFTVSGGYTVGTVQVFANGVQLANSDFTASNGTTVVVTTPRVSGDIIRTVSGLTSSSINNINALSLAYSVALGG
jgi:hypothetical protein